MLDEVRARASAADGETVASRPPQRPDGAFWTGTPESLCAHLACGRDGLTSAEAARRLARHGPNSDRPARIDGALRSVLRRMAEPFALILLAAGSVSILTGDWAGGAIIIAILTLSIGLDTLQEGHAVRAAEALRGSVALKAEVRRDGAFRTVPVDEVVPGDLIRVRAGDIVPADALVLASAAFAASEAALTGEPFPVEKHPGTVVTPSPAEASNALFRGAVAQAGEAVALVAATGRATVFGAAASALAQAAAPSPFQRDLREFGLVVARLTLVLVVGVLAVRVALGRPVLDSLLFAVALAVGLTPELLPMITTVTLSRGALRMRRFPQDDLFDKMAGDGRLTPALVADLAHRLAAFHARAPASLGRGGAAAVADLIALNDRSLRACGLVPDAEAAALAAAFRAGLSRHGGRLDARGAAGKIRRCHGDLTLRNICLFEGVPTPFDALEFDEALATTDVLYDLAFVLMDLWHRGRADLANLLFNRYLDETDEAADAGLMPFLMAIRAVIRAHVAASAGQAGEGRAYLALARSLLADASATLLAVGGLSGSGKSTLAAAVAPWVGAPPGARVVSSDRVRKRLHGVPPLTRLPPDAYRPAASEAVYAALREEAARVLAGGASAVLDAVFDRQAEREAVAALAAACGVPFRGVWLHGPVTTLGGRIAARRNDPSDATLDVLAAQAARDCGTVTWRRLDARLPTGTLRAAVLAGTGGTGAAGPAADPASLPGP